MAVIWLARAAALAAAACVAALVDPAWRVILCGAGTMAWAACVLVARRRAAQGRDPSLSMLVVLGSGGHTAEMIALLRSLKKHSGAHLFSRASREFSGGGGGGGGGGYPRASSAAASVQRLRITYVVAASDTTSVAKVRASAEEAGHPPPPDAAFAVIPRSREVGQAWLSSAYTTAVACVHAALLVLRKRPDVVLCNGPGTCVPVCLCAFAACRVLGLNPGCRQIFVESFCRVRSLSLSGKVLYPFVDRFVVQWTELLVAHPKLHKLEYCGCIT